MWLGLDVPKKSGMAAHPPPLSLRGRLVLGRQTPAAAGTRPLAAAMRLARRLLRAQQPIVPGRACPLSPAARAAEAALFPAGFGTS